MTRRSVWLAAAGALLGIFTAVHYIHGAFMYQGYTDYFLEIGFVRDWLATGHFESNYVYCYPPLYYLLSIPLARVSNAAGAGIMVALNQVLLIVCFGLMASAMVPRASRRLWLWLLLPLALNFRPLLYLLSMAKIELIQMTLLVAALLALQRGRSWMAGGLTALAGMMKPLPLLLMGYFLWKRDWRAVKGGAIVAAAILVVCSAVFGVVPVLAYFVNVAVPHAVNTSALYWYENQSLLGTAGRIFHTVQPQRFFVSPEEVRPADVLLGWGLRVALLGWLGYLLRPRPEVSPRRLAAEWSCAITGMLLLSPFARDYYAVFLLPAYVLLAHMVWTGREGWRTPACWAGVASYLLVGQGIPFGVIARLPQLVPGVENFHTYLHYGVPTLGYLLLLVAWASALRTEEVSPEASGLQPARLFQRQMVSSDVQPG